MKNEVCHSNYLRFSIRPNCLRVFITQEGRAEVRDMKENNRWLVSHGKGREMKSDLDMFYSLLEHFLCNGWTEVKPKQIGDLRSDDWLVISRDFMYADENSDDELIVGTAYSYTQYALVSYITPLLAKGYIDFERHEYYTPQLFEYQVAQTRPDCFDSEEARQEIIRQGTALTFFLNSISEGHLSLELAA